MKQVTVLRLDHWWQCRICRGQAAVAVSVSCRPCDNGATFWLHAVKAAWKWFMFVFVSLRSHRSGQSTCLGCPCYIATLFHVAVIYFFLLGHYRALFYCSFSALQGYCLRQCLPPWLKPTGPSSFICVIEVCVCLPSFLSVWVRAMQASLFVSVPSDWAHRSKMCCLFSISCVCKDITFLHPFFLPILGYD